MDDQNKPQEPNNDSPLDVPQTSQEPSLAPEQTSQLENQVWMQETEATTTPAPQVATPTGTLPPPVLTPDPTQPFTPGMPVSPKPKSKRGLIAIIITTTVLAASGVGAVFAYNIWNATPEKMIADSVLNLIKSRTFKATGNYTFESKDTGDSKLLVGNVNNWKLSFNANATRTDGLVDVTYVSKVDGKEFSLKGSAMFTKSGDYYIRLEKIKELLKSQGFDANTVKVFDSLIKKVENKWIKFSLDDLSGFTSGNTEKKKTKECVNKAIDKFEKDDKLKIEIADVYTKNAFITPGKKIGSKDGSTGFSITMDDNKYKSFVEAVNDTTFLNDLQACDKDTYTLKADDEKSEDKDKESFELWISDGTHEITKVSGAKDGQFEKQAFVIEPLFNQEVSITAPKDVLSFEEVVTEVMAAYTKYYEELYKSSASSYSLNESQTDSVYSDSNDL